MKKLLCAVKETCYVFTFRCKLFYQMDGAWKERGVGYLHLKKTDGVAQLLVRADTTLGKTIITGICRVLCMAHGECFCWLCYRVTSVSPTMLFGNCI